MGKSSNHHVSHTAFHDNVRYIRSDVALKAAIGICFVGKKKKFWRSDGAIKKVNKESFRGRVHFSLGNKGVNTDKFFFRGWPWNSVAYTCLESRGERGGIFRMNKFKGFGKERVIFYGGIYKRSNIPTKTGDRKEG